LYSAGANFNPGKSGLLAGEIISADNFNATIQLRERLPSNFVWEGFWAYCIRPGYSEAILNLGLDIAANRERDFSRLLDSIRTWHFVSLAKAGEPCDLMLVADGQSKITVKILDMRPLESERPETVGALKKILVTYGQSKFLKNLSLSSQNARIEMQLVPVESTEPGNGSYEITKVLDSEQDTVSRLFSENDKFLIKVVNKGSQKAYYNIVAIQPDSKIIPVVPNSSDNADVNSFYLNPGESRILRDPLLNGFYAPYGTEMLKLFATLSPIDLFPIVDAQGSIPTRSGRRKNPIEMVLEDYYTSSRGPGLSRVSDTGSTFEYVYTIVPPR
jgi:hypothetical protein